MAHEIKNPLSGIRGAAQLLEQSAPPEDRLTAGCDGLVRHNRFPRLDFPMRTRDACE